MAVEDRWHAVGPDGRRARTARYGSGLRWRARWRDETGHSRSKSFRTRDAADAFLRQVDDLAAAVLDPRAAARLTVGQVVTTWLATKAGLRPKSIEAWTLAATHVRRRWEHVRLADVRPSDVRTWLVGMPVGPALRKRCLQALRQVFVLAVEDGLLVKNPTDGVPMPATPGRPHRYLSVVELYALADAAGEYRPMVLLMGLTGMRIGEAVGLQVGDVKAVRRRIRIERSVSMVGGRPMLGPPKSGDVREVPVPRSLLGELTESTPGRPDVAPLFTSANGGRLNPNNWRRRVFARATETAGVTEMVPHDLRHTAASLAIMSGADVKAVQSMLGHASAVMTLDLYSHLFDTSLDTVADRLEELVSPQQPPRIAS